MTSPRQLWLLLLLLAAVAAPARAEVKRPAPPKEYDVALRFQIRAPLPGWYDRFDELLAGLKRLGFARTPPPADEPEDPLNDRLAGTVASENARRLLEQQYVQTILLRPRGLQLQANDRIKIRLELASGLSADRQQALQRQVVERLTPLGFREAPGYDHRGFTWVLGTIDAGRLDDLLRDLRTLPAGWLVPQDPVSTLPLPLRDRVPVKVIEVLPEPADVPPAQEPAAPPTFPEAQAHLAKLAPGLRALAAKDGDDTRFLRVEVILAHTPPEQDAGWERMLRGAALSAVVEGRLGNVATVLVRATQAGELARPNEVLHVRLPLSGEPLKRPPGGPPVNALVETRLDQFHARVHRGQGVKVVVVGGDFGGYAGLVGNRLARSTRLIDFTLPRNQSLTPEPMPSSGDALGPGTLTALAVRQAAPGADLVLVRVDPTSPLHLFQLARLINEPGTLPRVLDDRAAELLRDRTALDAAFARAVEERRRALAEQLFDPGDPKVPEQRRRYEESQQRVRRAEQALKDLAAQEAELQRRTRSYLDFRASLQELRGTRVVVCPLAWDAGWPLDGVGPLSRYLDEAPFVGDPGDPTPSRIPALRTRRGTVWVQATGDSRGQTWAGLFRDADGNGAMEFTAPGAALPRDRWTPEMNFLSWEPFQGAPAADLPAKARVRVCVQWREPHDPALFASADDPYRTPVVPLSLSVLKQRDPTGTKLGSDEMELVARSDGRPVRLQGEPYAATYETVVEFDAPAGGRFALRVEGRLPQSTRPAGDLAGDVTQPLEIRPRLFVEVLDAESRGRGRAVFMDYAGPADWPNTNVWAGPQPGGVAMPADAHNVLAIGAAGADGRAQRYSAVGAGPGRELLVKPEYLGFDNFDLGVPHSGGSWVAAGFNGGLVACLIGSGAPAQPRQLFNLLQTPRGSVLRVPADWIK